MLDGKGTGKIQVGMHTPEDVHANRKVGDKWIDSEGDEWEQMDGYRSKVSKMMSRGIADQCSDCDTYITKSWDKDSFKWNQRCYYCQIDFEAKIQGVLPMNKGMSDNYMEWALDKAMNYVDGMKEDYKVWKKEQEELENPYGNTKIANALANENVDTTNIKLKKNTN